MNRLFNVFGIVCGISAITGSSYGTMIGFAGMLIALLLEYLHWFRKRPNEMPTDECATRSDTFTD